MRSNLVDHFPFLSQLTTLGRGLLTRLPVRRAPARTELLRKGDEVQGLYLLTSGALRVYHVTLDGRESTLYWVKPGETCILALSATFKCERYPAWVQTEAEPVSFVIVPEPMFRQLLVEPAFRDFTLEVLSGRVFELMTTLQEVSSLRVEQRVASFLLREVDATGLVRVSQERLAAHLGTAREVVFRSLRSLVARGSVTTARTRIQIVDRSILEQLVGLDDERP